MVRSTRLLAVLTCGLTSGLLATLHAQSPITYNVATSVAQVSRGLDGRVVITMNASGDLRGALTLTITAATSDGVITSGEWALVNTFIDGGPEAPPGGGIETGEPSDEAPERLINRGTIDGLLTGGTLTIDADGVITGITDLQLAITRGSLEFEGVTSGSGTAWATSLNEVATSAGGLVVTF